MAKKYKEVYHHTRYNNFGKIVTNEGILFRGSYYERFDSEDYGWTKRYASPIIKKLCKDKGCTYVNDSAFKPIIISFGQEDKSDYMWTKYADNYNGIQFVLDYDVIRSYADDNLDYFNECVYLENNSTEIEYYLATSIGKLRVMDISDFQYNLEALSGLIKRTEYNKETEIRYVHPYSHMFSVNYENFIEKGDAAFQESMPNENDKECYICFPKAALLGITIGHQSADKLEEVKNHLRECGFDITKVEVHVLNSIP